MVCSKRFINELRHIHDFGIYLNTKKKIIPYTDSIKYLGFTFTNSHKDDNDMLRQRRMLYARSNRLVRLIHSFSRNVLPMVTLQQGIIL